nr:MAG TPA: hypothetical protein [Caudoviricetes sp.]
MWKKIVIGILLFFDMGFLINLKNYNIGNKIFTIAYTASFLIITFLLLRKKVNEKITPNSETAMGQNIAGDYIEPVAEKYITDEYIELGNVIVRADGKEITDEEIPYLMQVGYERALEYEENSNNPKFHRTDQEEELSFDFEQQYEKEISLLEKQLLHSYSDAIDTCDYHESIQKLENTLEFFYNFKRFCYSKGKGGMLYFQNNWEYLHSSNNPCFSYDSEIKDALKERKKILYTVMPEIIDVISKNNGILQKNIYELLPNYEKDYIRMVLRDLRSMGKVNAEKKGNTYILTVCK